MKNALIIVVFLFVIKPILPVLDYVINYEFIVKELCENKAKPEMKCNGKCHLMKEMAKSSQTDNPVSSDKKNSSTAFEVLFLEQLASLEVLTQQFPVQNKLNAAYLDLYRYHSSTSAFRPPAV